MTGRDRDAEGRARQARPRDALGRPLPYGSDGVEPVSEDPLPPEETIAEARRLLAEGRPFSAHEIYEIRWKSCPDPERALWKGLAQLCVAITHGARGNDMGARRLLDRAAAHLHAYGAGDGPTYGIDLAAEVVAARELVGRGEARRPASKSHPTDVDRGASVSNPPPRLVEERAQRASQGRPHVG